MNLDKEIAELRIFSSRNKVEIDALKQEIKDLKAKKNFYKKSWTEYSHFGLECLKQHEAFKVYDAFDEGLDKANVYVIIDKIIHVPIIWDSILNHEVAHMIEFKDYSRLLKNDFGFDLPSDFRNKNKNHNVFLPAVAREARVRAIQSLYGPLETSELGFLDVCNPTKFPCGKFSSMDEMRFWYDKMTLTTLKEWDEERIRYEWNLRLNFISEWYETKCSSLSLL